MIKERRFNVHPNVLSCLLHLRLKTELGVKASDTRADREERKEKRKKGKNKYDPKPGHLSKAAKKAEKERKEIEKEMREAEAEVDREERAKAVSLEFEPVHICCRVSFAGPRPRVQHTETLKLLFVLYFRILKAPEKTPLLAAALLGISKFAHLVNVDFFKDLLSTLRTLIAREDTDSETAGNEDADDRPVADESESIRHRLMCIVTAFELLSGQGTLMLHT
jgi:nucleolar complex protein 3